MKYLDEQFDLESPLLVEMLDEVPQWSAPFGQQLLELINYRRNLHVLDVGFGLGYPLIELAMRLGSSSRVTGIDVWKATIKRTAEKIRYHKLDHINLMECPAESMPFPDQTFDLVVSNNGINNVEDQLKVLTECRRVLRPGGQFCFSMNLETTMIELYNELEKAMLKANIPSASELIYHQIYEKRKPLREVKAILQETGFAIHRLVEDQFSYRFSDGSAMFRHYFIRLAFLEGWKSIVPEDKRTLVFSQVEKQLNQIATKKNGIQLTVPFVVFDCK